MQSELISNRRLFLCLSLSAFLHVAVFGYSGFEQLLLQPRVKSTRTLLLARLHQAHPKVDEPVEPMLKDTLAPEVPLKEPERPPATQDNSPAVTKPAGPRQGFAARERTAQRKLSEHLFYPAEAVEQGLEGEVRLLLSLDSNGKVLDAEIASSSGHVILDRAAVRAAYATGRLPDAGVRELILPVVFRLQ